MARVLAVIPARYGSSRLPGKPLLPILGGEPMIAHVVRAALAARTVNEVLVATDHQDVAKAAEAAGAHAVLTDSSLPTGTDRVAAAMRLTGAHADVVVNVQGDEPLIEPEAIDLSARLLLRYAAADIATLSAPLPENALLDPNMVKVVVGDPLEPPLNHGVGTHDDPVAHERCCRALFFSRAPIGVERSALSSLLRPRAATRHDVAGASEAIEASAALSAARLHVGLYAFRPLALQRFVSLPPSPLEELEELEQLRALEAGMLLAVGEVHSAARGVDTEDDLRWLEDHWRQRGSQ